MEKDWNTCSLGDVVNVIGGGTPKTTIDEYWKGDIPWLSVVDFQGNLKHVNQTEKTITELGLAKSSTKILSKGSLIISARGTVGELAILGKDMAFNQSCYGLIGKEDLVINDFLYYILKQKIKQLKNHSHGSVFNTIIRSTFNEILVDLPPLQEQYRIAEILGTLDDKIELNLEMNKTLEDMAMAIYKEWFVDFGPFQDGGFVDSELGPIPEGWELKTINAIIKEIIDHRGKTPKKMGGKWTKSKNNTIPALSAKNIKNGTIVQEDSIRYIDRELYDKWMPIKLESGDILMTSEAPLGELFFLAVKEDYCLSQRLFALRTNTKLILPWYLFFWLKSYRGQHLLSRRATGSTVVGIRQAELRKVEILKPPIHVQIEQDNIINCILVKMEANIRENKILKKTRDYILPKLISGKVRVKAAENKLKEVL